MLLSGVSQPWLLVLIATMGNSLGGLTNVILGRFFPLREKSRWQEKGSGLAKTLWRCHAVIKLDACNRRFTVVCWRDGCASPGDRCSFFCALARRYAMFYWHG
ncbi:putative inner membrane protein [Enterobacter cloacae subsp. cloacae GS1]|nr:putative inner membrane protein [Enterobacter cloacae subsp. cloacae GS1]